MTFSRFAVTGGTGSLGRALIRRLLEGGAERVVSCSRDEVKAEELSQEFAGSPALRVFLADVRDKERLVQALYGCEVVIHAAALKRITQSVYSPSEMVKTNVSGTMNVIQAATDAGVARVIVVSSDKAVQPTNLYGITKAGAECYAVQANSYAYPRGTWVSCVRYGNVFASRGSVAHVWRAQKAAGKPLQITDPRMTRFILTLREATDIILGALAGMAGGEIFVPILPAARIVDLAEAVAPGHPTELVGLRPGGEKLAESLLSEEEIARTCRPYGWHMLLVTPSHHSWRADGWLGEPFPGDRYTSDSMPFLSVTDLGAIVNAHFPEVHE